MASKGTAGAVGTAITGAPMAVNLAKAVERPAGLEARQRVSG